MHRSVSDVINTCHLSPNGTVGHPSHVEIYGWPLTPSVNFSSAYAFESISDLGAYHENKYNSVRYGRDSSLLVRQLETYFEEMYERKPSILFNSGMSAIAAAVQTVLSENTKIVTFGSYYRKTDVIFSIYEKNFRVSRAHYGSYQDVIRNERDSNNLLLLVESPSNPFLRLADVDQLRESFPNAKLVLDVTFQGLLNSRSSWRFADLVVMSCTKYVGGHNDLLGGCVVCVNEALYPEVWTERSARGGIIDNMSAYFMLRSLRTYDIRMERSLSNIKQVLAFVGGHELVDEIYYPGAYNNRDQSALFEQEHVHGGAVVTFHVNAGIDVEQNIRQLQSTKMAPSFGSVDSLIELPAYMSHWGKSQEDLLAIGLDRTTVRLSVGNEPIEYLLQDLGRLLS